MRRSGPIARHVVAVGAGKGGVGKSTVALGLALALREHGAVGVLDFDLYGPNIPAMLGIEHTSWVKEWTLARRAAGPPPFRPVERAGLQVVSTGFIVGEGQPLGLDPTGASLLASQLTRDVAWPELDYLVVDLPPGTSSVQHILVRQLHLSGAIVVVTPQTIAHVDGRKAVQMFRTIGVRVLGGVENMAGTRCPDCGRGIELYPPVDAARSIWSLGVDRLARLPFGEGVVVAASVDADDRGKGPFHELAAETIRRLDSSGGPQG